MAGYIALKPCSFAGQNFVIGDPIDATLVDASMGPFLMQMGIIAYKDAAENTEPKHTENNEKPTEPDREIFDLSGENKSGYTKHQLSRMTKIDLQRIGAENGLTLTEDMTKAQMAEAIMLCQML